MEVVSYQRYLFNNKPATITKYNERIPDWAEDMADAIMDESSSDEDMYNNGSYDGEGSEKFRPSVNYKNAETSSPEHLPYVCAMKESKNNVLFSMFVQIYSPVLDACVRENYSKMCTGCLGTSKEHLCEGWGPSDFVRDYGGKVLQHVKTEAKKEAWEKLVDSFREANISSNKLLEFMHECSSPEDYISKHKRRIYDVMEWYCDSLELVV